MPAVCIPSTSSFTSTPKSPSPPKSPKTPTSIPHVTHAHKPQAGCSITHNELHTHVPAANHIFSWCTPFGSHHQASVAQRLPDLLIESVLMAAWGALAPNMKSMYGAGPLCFTQFCDNWHITEEACMPADYALLCTFIGKHKGLQSGNTICSWLAGICSWHIMNHAPWYGDDSWVHLAHMSANKEGTKHKLVLCAPISIKHLSCLCCALDLSNSFPAAVWAVALVTFFRCCCLGETTVTVAAAFNQKYHALHSTKYVDMECNHTLLKMRNFSILPMNPCSST